MTTFWITFLGGLLTGMIFGRWSIDHTRYRAAYLKGIEDTIQAARDEVKAERDKQHDAGSN